MGLVLSRHCRTLDLLASNPALKRCTCLTKLHVVAQSYTLLYPRAALCAALGTAHALDHPTPSRIQFGDTAD